MKRRPLCLAWLSMLIASGALAQPASNFTGHEIPDAAEVARLLSQPDATQAPVAPRARTRAVRVLEAAETRSITPGGATTAQTPLPERFKPVSERVAAIAPRRLASVGTLSIAMRFDSNSTEVMANAATQLDAVAAGIKRLPPGALVIIEGHTDAYGADEYNRELSLQRAFAVRRYLVKQHGLPGTMLVAIGRGQSAPLAGLSPFSAENRRVEFRAEYEMQSALAAQMLTDLLFAPAGRQR